MLFCADIGEEMPGQLWPGRSWHQVVGSIPYGPIRRVRDIREVKWVFTMMMQRSGQRMPIEFGCETGSTYSSSPREVPHQKYHQADALSSKIARKTLQ